MLPSFYLSGDKGRIWSVARAAACGAGIGVVAALFKILGPLHAPFAASDRVGNLLASIPEIGGAIFGFSLLCASAAALRNYLVQRLIGPQSR
jgi:hypothetical protein